MKIWFFEMIKEISNLWLDSLGGKKRINSDKITNEREVTMKTTDIQDYTRVR